MKPEENYDWWPPNDVLTVHKEDMSTVAYGTPKQPKQVMPPDTPHTFGWEDERPLPKPPHSNDYSTNPGGCLACQWNDLREKIRQAQA